MLLQPLLVYNNLLHLSSDIAIGLHTGFRCQHIEQALLAGTKNTKPKEAALERCRKEYMTWTNNVETEFETTSDHE